MRRALVISLAVLLLAAVGVVSAQRRGAGERACDVCQRDVCRGTAYTMQLSWGRTRHACCPRCGLRYEREHPGSVRSAWVQDFATGRSLRADAAVYVEGSDFSPCMPGRVAHDQAGACYTMCFDRCAPSLVAFAGEVEAAAFAAEHGGALRRFATLAAR
jgi:hypothetical protein